MQPNQNAGHQMMINQQMQQQQSQMQQQPNQMMMMSNGPNQMVNRMQGGMNPNVQQGVSFFDDFNLNFIFY